jgi:hypothetical protein
MGRNNFSVKVLSKRETRLELELTIIREGQEEFYCSPNFALQLIYNIDSYRHAKRLEASPLGKEISPDNLFDKDWLRKNQSRFIAEVKITGTKNHPLKAVPGEWPDEKYKAFWADEYNLPKATYSITVTDKRWTEHIRPGQKWEAAAYDFFL